MMRNRVQRVARFAVFAIPAAVLFLAVAGYVVMSLWNWLLPALFGWRVITFWQAVGILVFSKILFGGFRGGRSGRHWYWRRRMIERWEKMTPEEREKFRQGMRCGPFRGPDAESKAPTG